MGLAGAPHAHGITAESCAAIAAKVPITVIVDPFGYQAGEKLADTARARGDQVIFVLSRSDLPPFLTASFRPGDSPVIVHSGNPEATWRAITEAATKMGGQAHTILPGTESGVMVADDLNEVARLPGNGTALSSERRDKILMHRRLEEMNLSFARSATIRRDADLITFFAQAESTGIKKWVIKPRASAGTDRVFVVETLEKAKQALGEILGGKDAFGATDHAAVIQEFLSGTEYIFDTVSTVQNVNGKRTVRHLAVGAWRYVRRPSPVAGRTEIIDEVQWVPYDELPKGLAEYGFKVLNAMGVERGPAHLEIMDTPRGPVLVEIGARLPGGLPLIAAEAAGPEFSQLELALDSYTHPEKIMALIAKHGGGYPTRKTATILFLSVDKAGQRLSPTIQGDLVRRQYPTLSSVRIFGKAEGELPVTTDVTNALLRAHLAGTPEAVARDARNLRIKHQNGGFYAP